MSALLTGLGQLYAGRPTRALATYAASLAAAAAGILGLFLIRSAPLDIVALLIGVAVVKLWAIGDAWRLARHAADPWPLRAYNRWYAYAGIWLLAGVGISQAVIDPLRENVLGAVRVPSASMVPTLLPGDYLYLDKRAASLRALSAGDLAAYRATDDSALIILKRVVGLPGDVLAMKDGRLYRNGQELLESYTSGRLPSDSLPAMDSAAIAAWVGPHSEMENETTQLGLNNWGPVRVPSDSFFALGDDRANSYDSRYFGFIPLANLVGRPFVIYFSAITAQGARSGESGLVRWKRIGHHI